MGPELFYLCLSQRTLQDSDYPKSARHIFKEKWSIGRPDFDSCHLRHFAIREPRSCKLIKAKKKYAQSGTGWRVLSCWCLEAATGHTEDCYAA